eukprot:EG_transcript_12028
MVGPGARQLVAGGGLLSLALLGVALAAAVSPSWTVVGRGLREGLWDTCALDAQGILWCRAIDSTNPGCPELLDASRAFALAAVVFSAATAVLALVFRLLGQPRGYQSSLKFWLWGSSAFAFGSITVAWVMWLWRTVADSCQPVAGGQFGWSFWVAVAGSGVAVLTLLTLTVGLAQRARPPKAAPPLGEAPGPPAMDGVGPGSPKADDSPRRAAVQPLTPPYMYVSRPAPPVPTVTVGTPVGRVSTGGVGGSPDTAVLAGATVVGRPSYVLPTALRHAQDWHWPSPPQPPRDPTVVYAPRPVPPVPGPRPVFDASLLSPSSGSTTEALGPHAISLELF